MCHSRRVSIASGLFDLEAQPEVRVARVHLDVDLPHLDYPLDYLIPDELDASVVPGALVKARLAGRPHHGWVVEIAHIVPGERRLHPLESVVSRGPVVDPGTYQLAVVIARKTVSTVSQVLSLALPPRHARTAKEVRSSDPASWPSYTSLLAPQSAQSAPCISGGGSSVVLCLEDEATWRPYAFGDSFVRAVADGHGPRAVWTPLPGYRDEPLAALVKTVRAAKRSVIIVMPTQAQARELAGVLSGMLPEDTVTLYHADLLAAERYRLHLQALAGELSIVVGTRSAVWLPAPTLGLMCVWDDGDDRLREQRAPRVDALDVAITRMGTRLSSPADDRAPLCAFVAASWARSVKAHALVDTGWAHPLEAPWEVRRSLLPKIHVEDEYELQREGARGLGQVSGAAQQHIRKALTRGPVLVQVPQAGFVPRVACQQCREVARCASCGGQLTVTREQRMVCSWCARQVTDWTCPHCRGHQLRALRIGSDLTGEHLGRAFPGIPLVVSSAQHDVTEPVDQRPRLVVATPGREPIAHGGYAMVLVVDAAAIAHRPELWAQEEALRRWMNAFALLSPQGEGRISGGVDPVLAQSLIRWDPAYLAATLLAERHTLRFFPAATVIALDGPTTEVHDILSRCEAEVMGIVPRAHSADDAEQSVRALIRTPFAQTSQTLEALRGVQQTRSAKKLPLVKITVNPPELF